MRRRLSVLVAIVVMLAMMLASTGMAWAADGCQFSCGEPTAKEEGKNKGWGDGNGGGKFHPKKKDGGCFLC